MNKINQRISKYREYSTTESKKGLPDYYKKLYEDASKQQNKKLELTNNVFVEQGISFKPKINSNYPVSGSFDERNQKLIELKGRLLEKMINENVSKPALSKEKIDQNNKRVVERLYKKEIEKIKKKNEPEIVSYKDNLKKRHKISFKQKNLLKEQQADNKQNLNENKDDCNAIEIAQEEKALNNKHVLIKDSSYIVQYTQDKNNLSQSVDSIEEKQTKTLGEIDQSRVSEEIKETTTLKQSYNLFSKRESVVENKNVNDEFSFKPEIELKVLEDPPKSYNVGIKSKTLQNLLNKCKK